MHVWSLILYWKTTHKSKFKSHCQNHFPHHSQRHTLTMSLLPIKAFTSNLQHLAMDLDFQQLLILSLNLNQEFLLFIDNKPYLAHCYCSLNSGCYSINPSTHSQEINCLVLLADCIFSMYSCNFCIPFLNSLFHTEQKVNSGEDEF